MAVVEDLSGIDIASPEVYERGIPHESFRLLRERDPVHWHPWAWTGGGFWAITKYDDVMAVAKEWETFSSAKGHIYLWELDDEALEARRSMIETDPPDHTRLRRIVSSAFTPRRVKDYEDYTRRDRRRPSRRRRRARAMSISSRRSRRRCRSTCSSRSSACPTRTPRT